MASNIIQSSQPMDLTIFARVYIRKQTARSAGTKVVDITTTRIYPVLSFPPLGASGAAISPIGDFASAG